MKSELLILSGVSGSGKSSALNILEDFGFFAIDNLPGGLLPSLIRLIQQKSAPPYFRRLALVMDVREKSFTRHFTSDLRWLHQEKVPLKIFFFDARDDVLIRRFSETRRRHPLAPHGRVLPALMKERELLHPVRALATRIVDTSLLNVHDLRRLLVTLLKLPSTARRLSLNLVSFGYRFGLPLEADLVFDVRFLPNPHFVPSLKKYSGQNARVRRFVLQKKETRHFLPRLSRLLRPLLKNYQREGKSYLTLAIGCTGGRHRSVVITETLAKDLKKSGYPVTLTHRDILRGD